MTSVGELVGSGGWRLQGRCHTTSYQDYRKAVQEEQQAKLVDAKTDLAARPSICILSVYGMTRTFMMVQNAVAVHQKMACASCQHDLTLQFVLCSKRQQ